MLLLGFFFAFVKLEERKTHFKDSFLFSYLHWAKRLWAWPQIVDVKKRFSLVTLMTWLNGGIASQLGRN